MITKKHIIIIIVAVFSMAISYFLINGVRCYMFSTKAESFITDYLAKDNRKIENLVVEYSSPDICVLYFYIPCTPGFGCGNVEFYFYRDNDDQLWWALRPMSSDDYTVKKQAEVFNDNIDDLLQHFNADSWDKGTTIDILVKSQIKTKGSKVEEK